MISIFAKPPFYLRHLQRVSSTVRGEQIAAYMGNARLNPPSGYENDTCIYVKPHIKPGFDHYFNFEKKSYVDIHEGWDLVQTLQKYPEVGVLALSKLDVETLRRFLKNEVVFLPHHHLNFERLRHGGTKIRKVGMTGSIGAFKHIPPEIIEGLKKRNIELETWSIFYPRTSVAKFHAHIDLHIQWRPFVRRKLSCPFKIINAASFGVPTIALDEPSFSEVEGCYIPVKTAAQWLEKLDELIASPKMYEDMAKVCIEKSEPYHIDNIALKYLELDK